MAASNLFFPALVVVVITGLPSGAAQSISTNVSGVAPSYSINATSSTTIKLPSAFSSTVNAGVSVARSFATTTGVLEKTVSPSSAVAVATSSAIHVPSNDLTILRTVLKNYRKHLIGEIHCSNKEDCCAGIGMSNVTLKLQNCDTHFHGRCTHSSLKLRDLPCNDMVDTCTCAAVYLKASLALIVFGLFIVRTGK